MKKQIKWPTRLSILFLCVCALAVGVYAAQIVTLTTNASLYFVPTKGTALVNGNISACNSEGAYLDTSVSSTEGGGLIDGFTVTGKLDSLTLPETLYFGSDGLLIINFVITNTCEFTIDVTIAVTIGEGAPSEVFYSFLDGSEFQIEPSALCTTGIEFAGSSGTALTTSNFTISITLSRVLPV